MIGKFGSDQQQLADLGGGVISEDGATLLSGESTGEASLLFGPAALREIQAGVANGDFAIAPTDAEGTITADNALPYWTFTDVNSAGAITCAVVADASAGSGNVLRWSVAANTTTTKSAVLSRFIPIAASRDQAYSYMPELALGAATSTTLRSVVLTMQFYEQDQTTTTGTALSETRNFSLLTGTVASLFPSTNQVRFNAPSDAAFLKISIEVNTTGTFASVATIDMYEVRTNVGQPILQVAERANPAAYGPGAIWMQSGVLQFSRNTPTAYSGSQQDLAILTNGTVVVSTNLTVNSNSLFNGNATVGGTTQLNGANSNWLARITATAAQSLTNNTLTKITFNTASATPTTDSYDPQTWFDNANDRIVIGQDGFYNITANVGFATNTTSRRLVQIFVNGSDRGSVNVTAAAAGTTLLTVSTNVYLVATDYVEVHALQQSGGALNTVSVTGVYPVLSVGRIGA
jgi:hypothetical protein